jgi:hypothetical protein
MEIGETSSNKKSPAKAGDFLFELVSPISMAAQLSAYLVVIASEVGQEGYPLVVPLFLVIECALIGSYGHYLADEQVVRAQCQLM